jgi:hypothetical protein
VRFGVTLDGTISVGPTASADADALVESHLDTVMDELMTLNASDADIALDSTDGYHVAFSVVVTASNPIAAVDEASGLIRSAIHAAGGNTPDWPNPHDDAWAVRLIGVRSSELVTA